MEHAGSPHPWRERGLHRAQSSVAEPGLHLLSVTTKGGPTRLEGKGCHSPGAKSEGTGSSIGWLGAASEGRGCRRGVALSRLSSFQLSSRLVASALASSSSCELAALSMSCRQSAQVSAPEAWAAQHSPGQSQQACWVEKQMPAVGRPQPPPRAPLQAPAL